jgi:hypothetical protein
VVKAGGTPERLAAFTQAPLPYPFHIAVDETEIYFTSETNTQLFRLPK